ncbi:MAG: hypothetical protein ABL927_04185 [Bdellovibrionales bacterium]
MEKNNSIRLVERDLVLLRLCCDFGYLTAKQINENLILATKQAAYQRLTKLVRAGYLSIGAQKKYNKTFLIYYPNIHKLVGILEKYHLDRAIKTVGARKWICSYGEHEDCVRNWALKIKSIFPEAQIDLDVMLINKKSRSEIQWLEEYKKLPDFIIHYKDRPKIAVEIELSSKSEERYVSRYLALMGRSNNTTLYLVRDEKVLQPILKSLKLATQKLKQKNYIQLSSVLCFTFEQFTSQQKIKSVLEQIWLPKVLTGVLTESIGGALSI